MRTIILLLLFTPSALAGFTVCHDGAGNIGGDNCVYFSDQTTGTEAHDRVEALRESVPEKYQKWDGEPVEMTAQEKSDKDAADLAAQEAAEKASWNAMVDRAIAKVDAPDDESTLIQECTTLDIITPEIRAMKANNPNPSATDAELKGAVKQCLMSRKR